MKGRAFVSFGAWLFLLVGIGALAGVWMFVHVLRPLPVVAPKPEAGATPPPANLAELRERAAARRKLAWSEARLAELWKELGPVVRWEERPRERDERRFLVITPPSESGWRDFLALVRHLEAEPAVSIESLDIEATGDTRTRRLVRCQLEVAVIATPSLTPPTSTQ